MQDEAYQTTNFIGGHWLEGNGEPREIIDPATGEAFVAVRDATIEQVYSAVVAAKMAGAQWAGRTTLERAAVMRRVADLIRRDAEALASLVVREQGKPISEARGEVAAARLGSSITLPNSHDGFAVTFSRRMCQVSRFESSAFQLASWPVSSRGTTPRRWSRKSRSGNDRR